ncbi:M28 family peptidase [Yeosuana sp. MJ-SS3]|uniref:M28 family peptidase n=1 Tax=Gilvirhabdus luticola TaxID=3079858 RepID=A0ABU3U3I0_9FLAO|nr:M28 family peptidase [Yeosuana sp. MJ-SS3]MDU8884894.1 M28 family peptidase [Yeosuana sp. MJ-SS3]
MQIISNIYYFIILLFVFSVSSAQNGSSNHVSKVNLFSETILLHNIKTISSDSFEGRRTGTLGAVKTKKYIINSFKSFDVKPLGKNYEQTFSFLDKGKYYHAVNVLGVIQGTTFPKSYVVISAHYDHEGIKRGVIYNGADDNASGLSALFSLAEYFKNNPPKHSVILAAFDGEELGLKGSKHFVKNSIVPIKDIMINFNLDMISRSADNKLFAVGTSYSKTLEEVILTTKHSKKINLVTGHDNKKDWRNDWTYSSDHASFHKKGIPFLYFGVVDHEDYHKPTDDYENINPEFYIEAVKSIISVFEKVDDLQMKR